MAKLNPFSRVDSADISAVQRAYGAPLYLYDEDFIIRKCNILLSMPSAYGMCTRYALKANSTRAIIRIIDRAGLDFDASSLNEVRRALLAGVSLRRIMLTSQEVPFGEDRACLERFMLDGLKYNVCSLRQLELVVDFATEHHISLSIRLHPGIGSGESASRNTGDDYSCFGVHLSDIEDVLALASAKGALFERVHVHIGSGGSSELWQRNIDLELSLLDKYFPHANTINFGGGLSEARMPDEIGAHIDALGAYAKDKLEGYYAQTGRKLQMEIEPGTFIVANAGYVVTNILDKKSTRSGLNFIVADGGMEMNTRPLMYGSRHPFYIISQDGELLSSEFFPATLSAGFSAVIVGRCCESGDAQSLDKNGLCVPRAMTEPNLGDIVVIGGTGAYCSSMSPFNYNSHIQAPEVLLTQEGKLKLIRRSQTLEQIIQNEI